MSQETLSALLDGECSAAELDALLAELERSPALKAAWSRQCLARDAAAGVHLPGAPLDFASGVMARIAAELPASVIDAKAHPRVVPLRRKPRPAFAWRPMVGMAAAASVAAAAVTLGINFGRVQMADQSASARVAAAAAAAQHQQFQQTADADEDLRGYVIEHSNTLADRGVGGALSYARFAARTGDAYAQPASLSSNGLPVNGSQP